MILSGTVSLSSEENDDDDYDDHDQDSLDALSTTFSSSSATSNQDEDEDGDGDDDDHNHNHHRLSFPPSPRRCLRPVWEEDESMCGDDGQKDRFGDTITHGKSNRVRATEDFNQTQMIKDKHRQQQGTTKVVDMDGLDVHDIDIYMLSVAQPQGRGNGSFAGGPIAISTTTSHSSCNESLQTFKTGKGSVLTVGTASTTLSSSTCSTRSTRSRHRGAAKARRQGYLRGSTVLEPATMTITKSSATKKAVTHGWTESMMSITETYGQWDVRTGWFMTQDMFLQPTIELGKTSSSCSHFQFDEDHAVTTQSSVWEEPTPFDIPASSSLKSNGASTGHHNKFATERVEV